MRLNTNVGVSIKVSADVVNIFKQLTLKEIILYNLGGPHLIF